VSKSLIVLQGFRVELDGVAAAMEVCFALSQHANADNPVRLPLASTRQ
jgi:hypothetical protein